MRIPTSTETPEARLLIACPPSTTLEAMKPRYMMITTATTTSAP